MALRVMALCVALSAVVGIQPQALKPVRIAFAGSTGLTEPFIERMKDAGREAGLSIEVAGGKRDSRRLHEATSTVSREPRSW